MDSIHKLFTLYPPVVRPAFRFANTHFIRKKNTRWSSNTAESENIILFLYVSYRFKKTTDYIFLCI